MIKSGNQVIQADGQQRLSWIVQGSTPTSVRILWDNGEKTVSLTADGDSYSCVTLIPSDDFTCKLDTEDKVMHYSGNWVGDNPIENVRTLEYSAPFLRVPYCNLEKLQVKVFNQLGEEVPNYFQNRVKNWILSNIYVTTSYGAPTLISSIQLSIPSGYSIELINHERVTNDLIVNKTICRDELYGVKWVRSF